MTWTPETNRIPFGLLTEDEKAAMQACEHGWKACRITSGVWEDRLNPNWFPLSVYRAKPAPKRIVTWIHWATDLVGAEFNTKEEATEWLPTRGGVVYRIERNEDGSDPQIFVEEV